MSGNDNPDSHARVRRGFAAFCAALMITGLTPGVAAAATETVLYSFTGGADGANPPGGLIADSSGNLYGTATAPNSSQICHDLGCSVVFKLSPDGTETVVFLCEGGCYRLSAVGDGNLYGVAGVGGPLRVGTVFRLAPPGGAGGAWSFVPLYTFCSLGYLCSDGAYPNGGLIADSAGNLYGTTSEGGNIGAGTACCGTVFKLSPPATAGGVWTETVLYSFTGGADGALPNGSLIADSAGNLYGTTLGGAKGTVFKLSPPATAGGAWTETVLYSFCTKPGCSDGLEPNGGLIADSAGNLYGTTDFGGTGGVGTVFKLSPPAIAGGAWTETVLHSFCSLGSSCSDGNGPNGGLIADGEGNLYGTTESGGIGTHCSSTRDAGCGTAFEITPAGDFIPLYSFGVAVGDGTDPNGGLIADGAGNLYGTTYIGGIAMACGGNGCGTVFKLALAAHPFGSFDSKLVIAPPHDYFELLSNVTLGSGAAYLDPPTEPAGIEVGAFTATIPPGSFVKVAAGEWDFDGTINGTAIHAKIWLAGTKHYLVLVKAMTALAGLKNPVPVTLTLGPNSGTASVTAAIYP